MDAPIARAEYEEHKRRMEDEHHRMNRRIELLEEEVRQFMRIATSTEKLALNMENMAEEQKRQGDQISDLRNHVDNMEKGPGDVWNRIKSKALDAFIGAVSGAFAIGVVLMIAQYMK